MTKLYIREFPELAATPSGDAVLAAFAADSSLADQVVDYTAAAAASAAFQPQTKWVLLCADSPCSIRFGTGAPTAVATDFRIPGNVPFLFRVPPNSTPALDFKVSAITNP